MNTLLKKKKKILRVLNSAFSLKENQSGNKAAVVNGKQGCLQDLRATFSVDGLELRSLFSLCLPGENNLLDIWPQSSDHNQTTVVDENLIGISSMKIPSMDAISYVSGTDKDLFVPEDEAGSDISKKAEEVHRRHIMFRAFTALKAFTERKGEKRALRLTADLFARNQVRFLKRISNELWMFCLSLLGFDFPEFSTLRLP
ncbi:hypothetical protein EG68_06795 [Paragonimus skrjabini miyazakii]|uniref:Uncharacterized protein n=1 Tax=Paragonimus skrjabini miyazakii TaxID=59628 RepID=A0A8S9Z3P8_9TREM|nr:hypothetical protein EG68_06795 [Paragonimus skrjabini miyazakii]